MASISLPPQPQTSNLSQRLSMAETSTGREKRLDFPVASPLPNPPFVFPAREPASPSAAMFGYESDSPPPLPPFSFNPGMDHASTVSTSAVPSHAGAGGHRRRASELNTLGSPGLLSTSPGRGENPAPSTLPPPGPGLSASGTGRRGHAHRRSAAISSMDLTAVSKAFPARPIAESAPSTPADMKQQHGLYEEMGRPTSRSVTSLNHPTPPASPDKSTDQDSGSNARVGFVETVTVIPRPLSTISSETSSSLSTIRPTQSVTSSGPAIPDVKTFPARSFKVRPKTADPSLIFSQGGIDGFVEDSQQKRPASAAGPSPSSRRASFPELQSPSSRSQIWDDSDSKGSSKRTSSDTDSSGISSPANPGEQCEPKSKSKSHLTSKANKKQKKVRSWAGAILTRGKSKKNRSKKPIARKTPTPPPVLARTNSEIGSLSEVDFDDDNIVIIRTPTNPNAPKPLLPVLQTNDLSLENSWKPKSFYEQNVENDMFSPVIDLDAALGPFNTPEMSSDRVPGSGFSIATRRMYSGGRRGEFVGPEMRYHRRAESAPEMPPFDRSFLGGSRFGSNPAMAVPDVFYEEEEDAFLAGNQSPRAGEEACLTESSKSSSANDAVDESSSSDTSATVTPVQGRGSAQDEGLGIQMVIPNEPLDSNPTCPPNDRHNAATHKEAVKSQDDMTVPSPFGPKSTVEIVEPDDCRRMGKADSPDVSPRFVPADKRPGTSPVDFAYNIPQLSLPADAPPNSTFPSPDPSRISFEVPRSTTASSSMTDRNVPRSLYSNDPHVEFPHSSVEDVPSLTSSASTMTNNMPRFSTSFYTRPCGERAASFSAPIPRRTSHSNTPKRSSLASLSKLVVGSHGERSKLSYEEKAPGDETEKSKKKGHRISRLMHFWKTKEKEKHRESVD